MTSLQLKEYLNFKAEQYNTKQFIESDPIQLPHRFSKKEDIEIVSFLVSTIAWGKRAMIIKSGERLLDIMEQSPHEFIIDYEKRNDLKFVHRTFNAIDLDFFFRSLKSIYQNGGMEKAFSPHSEFEGVKGRIVNFRAKFLQTEHEKPC